MNNFLLLVGGGILLPFLLRKYKWLIALTFLIGLSLLVNDSLNTLDRLERFIANENIYFPEVVIAQGILESGGFQSPIFKENNNWLGLKCPKYRETTCIGTRRGHAAYFSSYMCLIDYKLWQENTFRKERKKGRKLPSTNEEYIDLLIKYQYAEDPKYKQKLMYLLKMMKQWEQ